MKRIVLLDEGDFSYGDEEMKPLGGAQSAFIGLVKGLSVVGCQLEIRNNCENEFCDEFINWKKLNLEEEFQADCFIINRSAKLLGLVQGGKPAFFWLHNRGNYLLKLRNLKFLFKVYPTLVYAGRYHRSTFWLWPFFKNRIIPLGLKDIFFRSKRERQIPIPRAIFTSNPLRSLDWLVDRWIEIRQFVPEAELHIFSGPATYGNWGRSVSNKMDLAIQYAKDCSCDGIFVHDPITKSDLCSEIQKSRVMLYRGDIAETFCLAVAETLELGVPCITMNLGSMRERIQHGVNGFVLGSEKEFVECAVELLKNDCRWNFFHRNLVSTSVNLTWEQVARQFISKLK